MTHSPMAAYAAHASWSELCSPEDVRRPYPFRNWPASITDLIDLVPSPDMSSARSAELSSWKLGDITFRRMFFPGATVHQRRYRPRSFLDDWYVVLTRSTSSDQAELTLSTSFARNIDCCSLEMPFDEESDGSEVLMLILPRDLCEAGMGNLDRAFGLNLDPALAILLANYMDGLAQQFSQLSGEHARRLTSVTCSLVIACVAPNSHRVEAAAGSGASPLIDRALHIVRLNMASPDFDSEQLCRLLAVSRSKLYRIFECAGGVARIINRERLRDAHRRLSDPVRMQSIHTIAHDVGFEDHSTFSRAFRREFGYSPSEARAKALARFSHADHCHSGGDGKVRDARTHPP